MALQDKIKKYGLTSKDWYQHAHYTIVTRTGIDKIQAHENINIVYESITSTPEFCVVKAIGTKDTLRIETFGSAKFGGKVQNETTKKWEAVGNTTTWYVMEMAEKRAMSRAVLKITGFYELGVFGEDESEDFSKKTNEAVVTPSEKLKACKTVDELGIAYNSLSRTEKIAMESLKNELKFELTYE